MYYPLLTSSFFLVLLIIAYRQRRFFTSLLPSSLHSSLPAFLQPESGPPLPLSRTTSSAAPWTRRFLPSGWTPSRGYESIPGFDWASNIRNGLNSSLFDIHANIASADSRTGLDPRGAQDVQTIMARYNVVSEKDTSASGCASLLTIIAFSRPTVF